MKKLTAALLCLALLFAGCNAANSQKVPAIQTKITEALGTLSLDQTSEELVDTLRKEGTHYQSQIVEKKMVLLVITLKIFECFSVGTVL